MRSNGRMHACNLQLPECTHTCMLQQDLFATRVFIKERGDIINFAVDDEPGT